MWYNSYVEIKPKFSEFSQRHPFDSITSFSQFGSSFGLQNLSTDPNTESDRASKATMSSLILTEDGVPATFDEYRGQDSFFGGEPPLSKSVGYLVVLGFGAFFSLMTTGLVYLNKYFGNMGATTSEHFK